MEMRFSASIIEAIHCIMKLERGNLFIWPKGADLCAKPMPVPIRVEAPIWPHFHFFDFIKATPIMRIKHIESTKEKCGSWMLGREVEFFYDGERVAVVKLVGRKFDGLKFRGLDGDSSWNVTGFGYFLFYENKPTNWKEVEVSAEKDL